MTTAIRNLDKLNRIRQLLRGNGSMLIVMQDHPDPDAIASAVALRTLANTMGGIQCSLAHAGTLGRAENRALAKYLKLNLRDLKTLNTDRFDLIAMVDAQPVTGNTSLPERRLPHIVIDHHPIRRTTRSCPFTDIRGKYGATSTILYEYLERAGIEIKTDLATALVYGIRSDTQDLGRETSQADIDAYLALYPLANKRMLSRILNARIPSSYFTLFSKALSSAEVYGSAVLACVGETENPDMIGEVADLLIRKEQTNLMVCYGFHGMRLLLSVRTADNEGDAASVARELVGEEGSAGGHNGFAGGQVPLPDNTPEVLEAYSAQMRLRFQQLKSISESEGIKLVE